MARAIRYFTDPKNAPSDRKPRETKLVFKVINVFPLEFQDFISSYLLKGQKRTWIEETCNVKFKLTAAKREMYLSSDQNDRSKIDISTFPFRFKKDLDHPWKSITAQRINKKRQCDHQEILVTPTKKIRECDVESLSPIVKMVLEQKLETSDPSLISEAAIKVAINIARQSHTLIISSQSHTHNLMLENSRKDLKIHRTVAFSPEFFRHVNVVYHCHRNIAEIERDFIRES
jgi:hypothetical protein